LTGADKETVMRLHADVGTSCDGFQRVALRNLNCARIECDEIWSFVGAKQKNVPESRMNEYGIGDVYTWVALDPDSKLVVTWRVGQRSSDDADRFMRDLAGRLAGRVQITTDGYSPYAAAVFLAFGKDSVDFAQLVKQYRADRGNDTRYSPAEIVKSERHIVYGNPIGKYISTSHVERQNLTMRMKMRRFTRLTNAFSKKIEATENSVALHFMHYNFCRIHQTLKTTPAMAAGVADHVWSLEEVVGLLNPVRAVAA
jgi:IS1 family transposase